MAKHGTRGWAAAAAMGLALLAAGCSDSTDWLAEDSEEYDSGYIDGYEDGQADDGPTLGEILLEGAFTLAMGDGSDDGDGGGGGPAVRWRKARSDLVRGAAAEGSPARGTVVVRRSPASEEFRVEVRDGPAGAVLDVFLRDSFGVDFVAGSLYTSYRGRGELRLRSESWDRLPGGASSVDALAGADLEVRDGSGALALCGRVPSLRGRGSRAASLRFGDGTTGGRARVRLAGSQAAGRRRASVDLAGLPPGSVATLLVEDGDGFLVPEGTRPAGEDGTAAFRFDSRRGDPLPGGATDVPELGERAFRVLVDGAPGVEGFFPRF